MRIAVFGGSFDPVHTEHIQLARVAIDRLRLDKLLVMPAYAPPHKRGRTLTEDTVRLALCRLAFADVEGAEVSDFEIAKKGTSYTYLTCQALREQYPTAEIFWLVGTDMLRDFPTWREPNTILSIAELAVCGRNEQRDWVETEQKKFQDLFGKSFVYLDYNGKNISSTKIRVLAGGGRSLDGLVTPAVAAYIERERLYYIEGAKKSLSLQKPTRLAHSIRVAELCAKRGVGLGIPERQAIAAGLMHDCAKCLPETSPYLAGFVLPDEWGPVPPSVFHQFAGGFVAERHLGVADRDLLNAITYHTSGRAGMSDLEKLVFLADMVEEERNYEGVDELRTLFWKDIDECLERALCETIAFVKSKGGEVYPLTEIAYQYIKNYRGGNISGTSKQ